MKVSFTKMIMFNVNWVKVLRQLSASQQVPFNQWSLILLGFQPSWSCNSFGYLLVLIRSGSQKDYNKTVPFKVNLSASGMPSS